MTEFPGIGKNGALHNKNGKWSYTFLREAEGYFLITVYEDGTLLERVHDVSSHLGKHELWWMTYKMMNNSDIRLTTPEGDILNMTHGIEAGVRYFIELMAEKVLLGDKDAI